MTKQQIVVQLVAAKIANSGVIPHKDFLEQCGVAADKIIEMFPEPSTEIVYKSSIDHNQFSEELLRSVEALDDPNSSLSKSLARTLNVQRAK